jgi:hypothetical protein
MKLRSVPDVTENLNEVSYMLQPVFFGISGNFDGNSSLLRGRN